MKEQQSSLAELRRQIDEIDARLLALMNRRARLAQCVGSLKQADRRDFFRPEREAQVMRRLAALNDGPLSREHIAFVFREIISACLALETRLRVAYPRSDGCAGDRAVRERFGRSVDPLGLEDEKTLFRAVEAGEADFAVLPLEHFTPMLAECFRATPLLICAEGRLDAPCDACKRYWVIGPSQPPPSGEDKTTVLIELGCGDEAIDEALGPFTRHGVDLSRIETVQGEPGPGGRFACVDAHGHRGDAPVAAAIEELRRAGRPVKLLGSYPCAEGEGDA